MTDPDHIMPPIQEPGPLESGERRFSAEHDDDTYTIFFPDGHALTAWEDGRLVVTRGTVPNFPAFEVNVASLGLSGVLHRALLASMDEVAAPVSVESGEGE